MQHETFPAAPRAEGAEAWMTAYLADLFDLPPEAVDPDQPFDELGLDSAAMVAFTSDLGRWLGRELDLRTMIDHPTIRAVAAELRAA